MVPTIVDICGLTIPTGIQLQGQSIAPAILAGSAGSTYDQLQFESDDDNAVIRALIDNSKYNIKYVVSAHSSDSMPQWQCELYDFKFDPTVDDPWPSEMDKLIPVNGLFYGSNASSPSIQAKWSAMHTALTEAMEAKKTTPTNWPSAPPPTISA